MTDAEVAAVELRRLREKRRLRLRPASRVTRMRVERERLGLTVREVARYVGISNSFVSQVENGMAEPSLSKGLRLARFFGLAPGELLVTVKEEK